MTDRAPPASPSTAHALAELEAQAAASPLDLDALMRHGSALHAAGQAERALMVFEQALERHPAHPRAASACATLLFELDRPQAAYRTLQGAREALLQDADGAANLAIAAEACGQDQEARVAYERALALNPNHVRALNNLGLMAAREGRWAIAIDHAQRCVELLPNDPYLWANLGDLLMASRDYAVALARIDEAVQRFPQIPELGLRRAILLAFDAQFEASQAAFAALGPQGQDMLKAFLGTAAAASNRAVRKAPLVLPDAYELFTQQAFEALQEADWRDHDRLTQALRTMLATTRQTGALRDWRDTQFYALMLPLDEEEQTQLRVVTAQTIPATFKSGSPPFRTPTRRSGDDRIHVGLVAQSLRDGRFAESLRAQLALHDRNRFAFHVYSPTPQPEARLTQALSPLADSVVEIAHLSVDEMAQRIRLDRLDVMIDLAFYTPWCQAELPYKRVAPVQMRHQNWQRIHLSSPCEYSTGDAFTHPDLHDTPRYGAIVRFPHTCWLTGGDETPDAPPLSRAELGLPESALVLCSFLPAAMIDPHTFSLWMQALRALPDAVLWLPGYSSAARANLAREAQAANVSPTRLVFANPGTRAGALGQIAQADLFIDAVRFNANQGLVDALRMGVPAVTCAGHNMASRLGGSILRAAGLPEGVHDDAGAYVDAIISLGRDAGALEALRARLQAARATAPLFDLAGRLREWEAAWTFMTERARAGLPPVAFDVPPSPSVTPPANP
ncbi:tetratricopeptide repeat protein [Variovorax terrae]|uniref:protein O-GlcNAc transferase n=1 Tax=Variovorax terrae TaxID=2923278 RepID=A0A9X1VWX8_9BURK|nr:tetratricopeptide repeat protein [Variovorax terrae]MCJ0763589.1 tetratricopeptide repeat protein [Variovorax terrae]